MAMRDPKLRKQLETHYKHSNKFPEREVERDETAARMARILRDEENPFWEDRPVKSTFDAAAYGRMPPRSNRSDVRLDALKYAFSFGSLIRPTSDVLKVNCIA